MPAQPGESKGAHQRAGKVAATPRFMHGGGDGRREKRKTHRPRGKVEDIRYAMEIDWMVQAELTEAIPPAYTEFIANLIIEAT